MFGNHLHCYGYKVIQPSLRNSHLWTKRGKMCHQVKDSLGTETQARTLQMGAAGTQWGSQHAIWALLGSGCVFC